MSPPQPPPVPIFEVHLLATSINGHALLNPCLTIFNDSSFNVFFTFNNYDTHFRVHFVDLASIRIVSKKCAISLTVSTQDSQNFQRWAEYFPPKERPDLITVAADVAAAQGIDDESSPLQSSDDDNDCRLVQIPCCPPLPPAALEGKQLFMYMQMLPINFAAFRSEALPIIHTEGRRRRASLSGARATSGSAASSSVSLAREPSLFCADSLQSLMHGRNVQNGGNDVAAAADNAGSGEEDVQLNDADTDQKAAQSRALDGEQHNDAPRHRAASLAGRGVAFVDQSKSRDDDAGQDSDEDDAIARQVAAKYAAAPPSQVEDDDGTSKKKAAAKPRAKMPASNAKKRAEKPQLPAAEQPATDDGDDDDGDEDVPLSALLQQRRTLQGSTKTVDGDRGGRRAERSIHSAAVAALSIGSNRATCERDAALPPARCATSTTAATDSSFADLIAGHDPSTRPSVLARVMAQKKQQEDEAARIAAATKKNATTKSSKRSKKETPSPSGATKPKPAGKAKRMTKAQIEKEERQRQQEEEEQQRRKIENSKRPAAVAGTDDDDDDDVLAAFGVPRASAVRPTTMAAAPPHAAAPTKTTTTRGHKQSRNDDDELPSFVSAAAGDGGAAAAASTGARTMNGKGGCKKIDDASTAHKKSASTAAIVSFIDTPRLDDHDDGGAAKDDSSSLKINCSNISNVTSFVAAGATSMQRAGSVTSEAFQHDLRRLLTRDMNARDVPDFLRLALDFAEQKHLEQSRRDAVAALNASVSSVSRLLARCADGASQMHDEAAGQWRHVQEAVRAAVAVEFKAVMQAKVQRATERLQAELCEDAARLCEQIVAGHIGQAAAHQTSEMKNFAEQLLSSQQVVKAKFESVASKILNSGQQQ